MSFIVENTPSEKKYKLVPAGNHLGRCYRILDLGTQKSGGVGEVKIQRKIEIAWELHGIDDDGNPLTTDDGRPLSVDKMFTHSWWENANLRKMLQSWRGKPWTDKEVNKFDLENILGQWAMVTVVHRVSSNGKTYPNVDNLAPVPPMIKQGGLPEGHNDLKIFKLSEPDWQFYETLPKWKKDKIALSPEYQSARNRGTAHGSGFEDMEDDIPFN